VKAAPVSVRRKRRRARFDLVDWRDAADEHWANLDMLAELFEVCGELLEPEVVTHIGYWMKKELRALRTLFDQLEEGR
jgi:hypothetical protein